MICLIPCPSVSENEEVCSQKNLFVTDNWTALCLSSATEWWSGHSPKASHLLATKIGAMELKFSSMLLKSIIEQQSSKASHVETAQSYKSKDLVHQSLTTRVKQPLHFNLRWRPEVDSQEIIFLSFSGAMANHVFHTILQCHKCSPKYKHLDNFRRFIQLSSQ